MTTLIRRLIIATVCALLLWTTLRNDPAPVSEPSATPAPMPAAAAPLPAPAARCAFDRTRGVEHRYDLSFESRQALDVPSASADGGSVAGRTVLRGTLLVRSYGPHGQGTLLGIGLLPEHAELELLGRSVFASRAAVDATFGDREVFVEVASDGRLGSLHVRSEDPPLFGHLMQLLITETQSSLRCGSGMWTVTEHGAHGTAPTTYRRLLSTPNEVRIAKTRAAYDTLRARGTAPAGARVSERLSYQQDLVVGADGVLQTLSGREDLHLAADGAALLDVETTVSLARVASVRFDATPIGAMLDGTVARTAADVVPSRGAERRALAQRVDGLTIDELRATIARIGVTGPLPGHNRFLWRATGLLKLEPARIVDLAVQFGDETLDTPGRALILDLLASTATPRAQAAMRRLLDSPAARADDEAFTDLFQRLALVQTPTAETADFVEDRYLDFTGREQRAATYTLGATAGFVAETGDVKRAAALSDRLATDLEHAADDEGRIALIRGLGNAGLSDHAASVLPHASAESADVRAAVADALRALQTPEAEARLIELAVDPSPHVQRTALTTLTRYELTNERIEQLVDAVRSKAIHAHALQRLVELAARHIDDPTLLRPLADAILTHPGTSPNLQSRVRGLVAARGAR